MALPTCVEGGGRRGILIDCVADGAALDLTSASGITGKIISQADITSKRAIAGTLTVSGSPTLGQVQWAFHVDDLVAGAWLVQITVSYASGLPDRSFAAPWVVEAGY